MIPAQFSPFSGYSEKVALSLQGAQVGQAGMKDVFVVD